MKILFYNHTGKVSGAEYLLLMVLARLDHRRFEPVVICPAEGPLQQLVAELDVSIISVEGLNARFTSRPDRLLEYLKSFVRVIRDVRRQAVAIKPDLIHANSIRAGLVATAATLGLPARVAWHLHDLMPRHPLSSLIRTFARISARTQMIAVSQAVADNFAGALSELKRRTTVILNGIDLAKFKPALSAGAEIRTELGIQPDDLVIGIVGQLTPRKGQLELIRAFNLALREIPRTTLLIVGAPLFNRDEQYVDRLKQTAAELGISEQVLFTGARKDVAAVMQSLDLLIVNSSTEPFGLVALESLACGTPVLAAISGGIPELIEHGKTGWLVPQGDEQALVKAMVYLGRRPEIGAQLAEQGRQQMSSRFSAERYLEELHCFYGAIDGSTSEQGETDEHPPFTERLVRPGGIGV